MRISTRDPQPRKRRARPSPSPLRRAISGALGAGLGGLIGYGLATSSPVPRAFTDPLVLKWMFGLGAVIGIIAALAPGNWLSQRSIRSPGSWLDDPPDDSDS